MALIKTFKQLLPAEGWYAVYFVNEPPYYYLQRIPCWALVRKQTWNEQHREYDVCDEDEVIPLGYDFDIRSLDDITEEPNFYFCIHERDITEEYRQEWQRKGQLYALTDKIPD